MTPTRTILELARGDFLERSRRYSFLLTLGAAACLAYTVHAGWWLVRIGDVAPAPGPARLGMLVGVATGTMLSLVGFYVVRGSVERDRRTGVGPILAAAPATRLQYAAAKFAGNLAVLGAMLAVVALLAVGMVASAGAPSPADAWRAVAPTVLLAGPALALVAGTALLFDSVPALWGAGGNVLYFFLWTAMLGASLSGSPALDVTGIALLHESLREAMTAAGLHETAGGLTVQARTSGLPETTRFAWSGVDWSAGRVAWRAYWVAAGAAMTGLAAASLRAFDVFGDDASPADAADAEAAEGEGAGDRAAPGAGGASRAGPEGRDPAKAHDPAGAALGPRTAADSAEVTVAGSAPPLPARGASPSSGPPSGSCGCCCRGTAGGGTRVSPRPAWPRCSCRPPRWGRWPGCCRSPRGRPSVAGSGSTGRSRFSSPRRGPGSGRCRRSSAPGRPWPS